MSNIKFYELTQDVTNPRPDRRSKDWINWPVIKSGTRFIFRENAYKGEHPYYTISLPGSYGRLNEHDELSKLMLANANEAAPESWQELAIAHDCDYGAGYILKAMLKLGRIDGDDFAAVADMPEED